jgi:hypothetical protein
VTGETDWIVSDESAILATETGTFVIEEAVIAIVTTTVIMTRIGTEIVIEPAIENLHRRKQHRRRPPSRNRTKNTNTVSKRPLKSLKRTQCVSVISI